MGKSLSNLPASSESIAMEAIDGYAVAIDMTARNVQDECKKKGLPWTIAKGFDTFCPISDYIPKVEIPDPHQVGLWLDVNGKRRQQDSTALMLFNIPRILSEISGVMRLDPGDIVLTGTPKGVGEVTLGDTMSAGVQVNGQAILEGGLKVSVEERRDGYVHEP